LSFRDEFFEVKDIVGELIVCGDVDRIISLWRRGVVLVVDVAGN
jgi:hypothetical protein